MEFIVGALLFGVGMVILVAVSSDIFLDVKKRRDEKDQDIRNY